MSLKIRTLYQGTIVQPSIAQLSRALGGVHSVRETPAMLTGRQSMLNLSFRSKALAP